MRGLIGFLIGVCLIAVVALGMEAQAARGDYYTFTGVTASAWGEPMKTAIETDGAGSCIGVTFQWQDGESHDEASAGAFLGCAGAVTGQFDTDEVEDTLDPYGGSASPPNYTGYSGVLSSGQAMTSSITFTYSVSSDPPPEDTFCEKYQGTELSYTGPVTNGGAVNKHGCECSMGGAGNGITVIVPSEDRQTGDCIITGNEYAGGDGPPPPDDPPPEEQQVPSDQCVTGSSGRSICADDKPDQECGFYNGERYCVGPTDQPQCLTGGSGTVVCQSDGTDYPDDAPKEDFGGDKPPADEWEHFDDQGNPHPLGGWPTGGGSGSGDGFGGGTDGASGGDGTGSTGDGSGDGSGDGDGLCDPNLEDCGEEEGPDLGEVCAEGVDCDAGGGMSDLLNTIQTQGIVAEATGLALPSGGGACPPLAFDTELTGALSTDVHCTIAAEQSALISGAMRAVWIIAALFVLLSG